jgi:hypothetical protein
VVCDDTKDAMRAARHLVEDVGVPAIIGFRSSAELIDVGSALLVPNGVLGLVSLSDSSLVTRLPNRPGAPRVVWRTTTHSDELAKVIGGAVAGLVEPQVRAELGAARDAPIRVAFVMPRVRGATTFHEELLEHLRFNGKSAFENGTNYRAFFLAASDVAKLTNEKARITPEVAGFAPNIVLQAAGAPLMSIEKSWPGTRPRPHYLVGTDLTGETLDWIGSSVERRRRVLGLQLESTKVHDRFIQHYNESAAVPITRTSAPDTTYDAFYVLAYATYALGDEPVTGANLSRAIGRLVPPGKPIDVGPASIFEAYSALRRNERIDLVGATGSLDFNLETGEIPFDYAVLCPDIDSAGRAVGAIESGVVFRSAAGVLEGTLHCP